MLDLAQIEGFDWDEGNSRKSVEKHDVSQAEAEQIFFNDPLLVVEDVSHSVRELRLQALGRTDAGRLLHISFTLRGDGKLIRVISARTMHRKERLRYEHEILSPFQNFGPKHRNDASGKHTTPAIMSTGARPSACACQISSRRRPRFPCVYR